MIIDSEIIIILVCIPSFNFPSFIVSGNPKIIIEPGVTGYGNGGGKVIA